MLQYRADVKFLSMEILVWSYLYCDGNFVYLRHNTCLGAVLDFTSYTHRSYMKFAQFCVTRTPKLYKLSFMIYYICLKILEMQTGWWSNSVRRDHTIWRRVKMERGGRIQYCKIQQWITLKINTKFWNGLYIPTHFCVDSKVTSDSVIAIWYTVWDRLVTSTLYGWKICQRETIP